MISALVAQLEEMRAATSAGLDAIVSRYTDVPGTFTDYNGAFGLWERCGDLPRLRIAYARGRYAATAYQLDTSWEWGDTLPQAVVRAWLKWTIYPRYDPEIHEFMRDFAPGEEDA